MKTFILILTTAICAFGAAGDYTLRDDGTLLVENPKGEKIVAGRMADHIVIRQAKVQAAIDTKLAAKATTDPLAARQLVDAAKAAGATVQAATEAKVVAAEAKVVAAEADEALIKSVGELTASARLQKDGTWLVEGQGKKLILPAGDKLVVNILNCEQFKLNRDASIFAFSYKTGIMKVMLIEPREEVEFLTWDFQTSTRINELVDALKKVE